MTGFGQALAPLGKSRIQVNLRAVNHRFLDLRVRLPRALSVAQTSIEDLLKQRLVRGHIEATVSIDSTGSASPALNKDAVRDFWEQMRELRDELDPNATLSFELLRLVPDLFNHEEQWEEKAIVASIEQATKDACAELEAMRNKEGAKLQEELLSYFDLIQTLAKDISDRRNSLVPQLRERYLTRINELISETKHKLDEGRLEQEIAILVQRGDIAEELSRLSSHVVQGRALLEDSTASKGKKLDFLLQEMGREVNTIGSKSQDALMAQKVVD
ncbi:MAG: YicC family protein [Myxococcales bacterium]|nr:MAG: YicC family protein [Myxococcales bacterium]